MEPDSASSVSIRETSSGITDVPGFQAAAVATDVRGNGSDRLDLALLYSEVPGTTGAAVFTRNDIQAAPVRLSRRNLTRSKGRIRAVIANSGNANACTGSEGDVDAETMVTDTARALAVSPENVLVCSTGRIGKRLPIDRLRSGIAPLAASLSTDHASGLSAAQAILTSDTRPKLVTVDFTLGTASASIGGFAKGAGMIQPNMATMLAFLATNIGLSPENARILLGQAVRDSFNCISIDGDMSTNDTVVLLANGHSGSVVEPGNVIEWETFQSALTHTCQVLAEKIVNDGEKITRVIELKVEKAASPQAAEAVARAIGNSLLVKSSWYGGDPNWGRLLDAAGYAGAGIAESRLELYYEGIPVFTGGRHHPERVESWREVVNRRRFSITLRLNQGKATFRLLTTDLTEAYVDFNKSE